MTPWRSRAYLDLSYAPGKTCLRCGNAGCEPCHYSGLYGQELGRGGGQKAFDVAADLCRACHNYFDQYQGGNDDGRAAQFLVLILKTLHRNLQAGHVELVVHAHPVQRDLRPSREHRRRKQRSTATPTKVFPRNPTRLA